MKENIFFKFSILVFFMMTSIASCDLIEDSKKIKKNTISVKEKKRVFRKLLVPAINEVYAILDKQYNEVKNILESGNNNDKIKYLIKKYNAKNEEDLLARIKPHPKSIALAQAAMESGWATSRFFNVAKNVFGVCSIDENELRIPASQSRKHKQVYLKKYENISDSVMDYYMVLSKNKAFSDFRKQKMISDDPYLLVKKLDKYSEKGAKYGEELSSMIKYNKFYKLDE